MTLWQQQPHGDSPGAAAVRLPWIGKAQMEAQGVVAAGQVCGEGRGAKHCSQQPQE